MAQGRPLVHGTAVYITRAADVCGPRAVRRPFEPLPAAASRLSLPDVRAPCARWRCAFPCAMPDASLASDGPTAVAGARQRGSQIWRLLWYWLLRAAAAAASRPHAVLSTARSLWPAWPIGRHASPHARGEFLRGRTLRPECSELSPAACPPLHAARSLFQA